MTGPYAVAVINPAAVRAYAELVFPQSVTGALSVWSVPAKGAGRLFRRDQIDELVAYVTALDAREETGIYLRMSTMDGSSLALGSRGSAEHTTELVGLWSDLDIAGPGHKHDPAKHAGLTLPPDEAAARKIVPAAGLPQPTVWVHSGGGLYGLWLLHDRIAAAVGVHGALSQRWQDRLAAGARELGYHYGSGVGDLARVLRLPGTVNRKVPGAPALARVLSSDGPRYALAELAAYAPEQTPRQAPQASAPAKTGDRTFGGLLAPDPLSPLDDFEARTDWAYLLQDNGWTLHHVGGDGTRYWERPGGSSTGGHSATTGHADDRDRMYCFSDAAGLPVNTSMTKPFAWAALTQGTAEPDMKAAAAKLAALGYGAQPAASAVTMGATARTARAGRPELHVGAPAQAVEWLRETIGTGPLAGFFLRDGEIVHCPAEGADGYAPPGDRDHDGPAQVRCVTAGVVRARVQAAYHCFKEKVEAADDDGGEPTRTRESCLFPRDAAPFIVDAPDTAANLRRLHGVTHTPLVRADGSVLDQPGFDPATGYLFLPDGGLTVPPVPQAPTAAQVRDAVALLGEMTAGFPFVSQHHRANFYGAMLTPLLREVVGPPYKLIVFDAPMPRSGKTLLACLPRILHGGVFRSECPGDEAEWSKTLATVLDVTTGAVVTFDNVTGTLRSGTLAGMLTSPTFDARRLGSNTMIARRNDRLWTITANNARLGGDLVPRSLWVTIDPKAPHPEHRTGFAIADLPGWTRARRGDLLAALLTLIRAWVVAGMPYTPAGDVYGRWVGTVRAILAGAGVPGVFDAPESAGQSIGEEDEEWSVFLRAVHASLGGTAWTARELTARIEAPAGTWQTQPVSNPFDTPAALVPRDALPGPIAEKLAVGRDVTRPLGVWLRNRAGRWAGGLCVRSVGVPGNYADNTQRWRIEVI